MGIFNRPVVSVEEARDRTANGALLVDVRRPDEVRAGMADGAIHVPMDLVERKAPGWQDREVLVICRSGNRSATVTSFLRRQGVEAFNVKGGMLAWERAGLPTSRG